MKRFEWYGLGLGLLLVWILGRSHDVCEETSLRYGLGLPTCPDGRIRQTAHVEVTGLRRGAPGTISIGAVANYTTRDADEVQTADVPKLTSVELALVDAKNVATAVAVDTWLDRGATQTGTLKLPDVPDGDYKLRVKYATRLGEGELDVAVPLYTPARIHVITDRPLYEPGNTVKFRAVVLRARDLAPLDGRPGMWVVKDPNGEVLLEEKAPATEWGVVAGSFPLDKGAATGQWRVAWVSADATDEIPFTVEPFTLPRFRVEASTAKAFYRPGDVPSIKGAVVYSSGAPVANAQVDITWRVEGRWPPPVEWQQTLLPKHAQTAANGRFELTLPAIPQDLQGQATMVAQLSAVDPAGDRVAGNVAVQLSEDGILVSSVTEIGDGLVNGFNNRMYVRVTTPDGRVLANTPISIRRAWQQGDKPIETTTDEDGVASVQIDPGAAVNVVIPALPFRPTPRAASVTRGEATELVSGQGASLADQVEMDRWLPALAPCAKWVESTTAIATGVRVAASGAVVTVGAPPGQLARCVADVVRTKRLPAGAERMFTLSFTFEDPELSKLHPTVENTLEPPAGLAEQIEELARGTRDCLPQTAGDGALGEMLTWRVKEGAKVVELSGWIKDPQANETADAPSEPEDLAAIRAAKAESAKALACVRSRIGTQQLKLADEAPQDSLGIVRFAVELPERINQAKPQATTMLGYELVVSAAIDGKPSTKLRVSPGQVPDVRLRVDPILAKVGETVTATMIRGPNFKGKLPKELELVHLKGDPVKVELDADKKAKFTIAPKTEGWVEIRGGGVRALVYVKPEADLLVSVQPKQPKYAPGQRAELQLRTLLGGKGGPAAVGLFGVDESLGQLATLPGAGDMARVQPKVETTTPAFGSLDGQALALGRIRGSHAAAATVLRVSQIPQPPELDAVVNARAMTKFDAIEELTDHFYLVLAELHAQARIWEAKAPTDEKMRPETMATLWNAALAACEKRGERVDDAYGRKLRLHLLPEDLLALTDPRAVIVQGTRLPEDVENWAEWVAKEKP